MICPSTPECKGTEATEKTHRLIELGKTETTAVSSILRYRWVWYVMDDDLVISFPVFEGPDGFLLLEIAGIPMTMNEFGRAKVALSLLAAEV